MGRYVAAVLCAALVVPAATSAAPAPPPLLRRASKAVGLRILRPVRVVRERSSRFERDATRFLDRMYPRSLQRLDDELYMGLGLLPAQKSIRSTLVSSVQPWRAMYDPSSRVLRTRRTPAPRQGELLREYAHALLDQNFNLRRLDGLRARDRDAALAADAVIDGIAAIASRARPTPLQGTPLQRFIEIEQNAGVEFGENLISQLRYLGGRSAVATALRAFPRTTAQVLQLDRFLEREPPSPISLPSTAGDSRLTASETFGELDVLALLRAFYIPNAETIAAGWSGGKIALYAGPEGNAVALALKWESDDDESQWSATVAPYVKGAFPDAVVRACPAVTACWLDGTREIAAASSSDMTVLVSGVNAELIAATVTAPR